MKDLIDTFGRTIRSLRLSLTDRCNLRCTYCMPEEGLEWSDTSSHMTLNEIIELIGVFYDLNIRDIRLTGGEPTLRPDLVEIIHQLKSNYPDIELSMTTNGIKLTDLAENLHTAGLDRINISLDTLDHQKFEQISRRDVLDKVLSGIITATEVGIHPVKINTVSIKNFNDDIDSIQYFLDFSKEHDIEIRFIEFMPFTGNGWDKSGFISTQDLKKVIRQQTELIPLPLRDKSSTSRSYTTSEGSRIGFISSVTESFCANCDRIRITMDGKLRPCLHSHLEADLLTLVREPEIENNKLISLIRKTIEKKWAGHPNFLNVEYLPPIDDREMIKIGG